MDFEPEDEADLIARYPAAVAEAWLEWMPRATDEMARCEWVTMSRRHVFDYRSGLRLVVAVRQPWPLETYLSVAGMILKKSRMGRRFVALKKKCLEKDVFEGVKRMILRVFNRLRGTNVPHMVWSPGQPGAEVVSFDSCEQVPMPMYPMPFSKPCNTRRDADGLDRAGKRDPST
jgi:hypothetical protein